MIERIRLAKQRAEELRRKRERRPLRGLSAMSIMLLISLTGAICALSGERPGAVPGLYGATLLNDDAGGYVLAAVLAFMAGVVVTVMCLRYRRKKNI
jgi:fructose-specific phosphotransferase system IIC component